MLVTLYDLCPKPGVGPLFSPAVARIRLALEAKGVEYRVVELTYADLTDREKTREWRSALKLADDALLTVPFIQKENGKFLMDSTVIARWLDRKVPEKPSIFTPDTHPYDVESDAYKQSLKLLEPFRRALGKVHAAIFYMYAPALVDMMDKDSADYFKSDKRFAPDTTWSQVLKENEQTEKHIQDARQGLLSFDALLSEDEGRQWFTSRKEPGWQDYMLAGSLRMLWSTRPELIPRIVPHHVGKWVERLNERFPLYAQVRERDPK